MSLGRREADSKGIPLFINVKYDFHKTLSLRKRRELEEKLNSNGAEKVDRDVENGGEPTHIITTRYFEGDNFGVQKPPFIVTPLWVEAAIKNDFVHSPLFYSPNPEMLFSGMVVTAPTLPDRDKVAICAALRQLGGQYRDSLTDDTTHLVAISEQGRSYERAMARKIAIVLPHYFDECLKVRRLVRMDSYSFPNPPLLDMPTKQRVEEPAVVPGSSHAKNTYEPLRDLIYPPYGSNFGGSEYQVELPVPVEPYLQGDCIYVEPGAVTPTEEGALATWLEYLKNEAGATIADEYDKDRVTIVVALNRSTPTYIKASQDGKLVASKWWLTNTISRKAKELPIATLIDYPFPYGGIPGTEDCVVSITGYRGTGRDYLRRIIIHCGMHYSTTLTKDTKFLVCSGVNDGKYRRAKELGVSIVNHIWLEECFRQWRLLPGTDVRFFHFPSNEIMRSLVGNTSHDPKLLERWWKDPANKPEEVPLRITNWMTLLSEKTRNMLHQPGKPNSQRKAAEDAATSIQDVYVPDMNAYQKEQRGKRARSLQAIPERAEDAEERNPKKQKSDEGASDIQSEATSEHSRRKAKSPTPPALKPSTSSSSPPPRVEKKPSPTRSTRKKMEKAVDALKATSAAVNFTEKPKILFTAIKATKEMESKLKRLGAVCVKSVDKATHLVVQDRVLRTPKFLCAVNLGINIVTLHWLNDSFAANQWQDTKKYIPKDVKNTSYDLEAILAIAREMREAEGSRRHATGTWLSGFDVLFLQNDEAKAKDMYDIVTTAGGKVVQRLNNSGTSNSLLVLSSAEKQERWEGLKENGIPIYDTELIIAGSLRQRLDLELYRLI